MVISNRLLSVLDGDMVTIFDSADLAFAIHYCRILKLKIYMKGKSDADESLKTEEASGLDGIKNLGDLRRELRSIRDHVNRVLDVISDNKSTDEQEVKEPPKAKQETSLSAPASTVGIGVSVAQNKSDDLRVSDIINLIYINYFFKLWSYIVVVMLVNANACIIFGCTTQHIAKHCY